MPANRQGGCLEFLRTVDCEAQGAFRAAFFTEECQPDGIRFWLGNNFWYNFVVNSWTVKADVPAARLNVYAVTGDSTDRRILAALGGRTAAKTSLAYTVKLVRAQGQGQKGVLLTNGYGNVFYVEDHAGVLWEVLCNFYAGDREWAVCAFPVTTSDVLLRGNQVFSPAALSA